MKIMVGYDGSEMAHRALVVAQNRAKALRAELHIFSSTAQEQSSDPQNARLEQGRKESEMFCAACYLTCKITMSAGSHRSVAEEIVRYAKEHQIDEIVIGLRRRSPLGKLLFGSTSRQVILDAPCPVLSVK
jgi:nucleotide-binding universal stress UspA family protein